MVRGIYTAAAGAVVAQANIDVISNNLANASTNGFKRAVLQISSQPSAQIARYQTDPGHGPGNRLNGVPTVSPIGALGSGSQIVASVVDSSQGVIAANGNPLNFALVGAGYFAVRGASGTVTYTRDGSFIRAANGTLETENGAAVLDRSGNAITLPGSGAIVATPDGTLSSDGATIDRIGMFNLANASALTNAGNNQYLAGPNAGVSVAANATLVQGAQEKSNADVVSSMVGLIANERWFDAAEKVIQSQDDATGQAITTLGRSTNS